MLRKGRSDCCRCVTDVAIRDDQKRLAGDDLIGLRSPAAAGRGFAAGPPPTWAMKVQMPNPKPAERLSPGQVG